MRSFAFVLAGLLGSTGAGCGGSEPVATERPRPAPAPVVAPAPVPALEVAVAGTRVGAALRLDIEVAGRAAAGGRAFEDPERWTIEANQADQALARLVNGSTEVERVEAARGGWDSVVKFNMVFELKDASTVTVVLTPPGGQRVTRTVEPGEAPEPVPGAPDPEAEAAEQAAKAKAEADVKKLKKKKKKKKAKKKRKG
jgi:hypothetical protein